MKTECLKCNNVVKCSDEKIYKCSHSREKCEDFERFRRVSWTKSRTIYNVIYDDEITARAPCFTSAIKRFHYKRPKGWTGEEKALKRFSKYFGFKFNAIWNEHKTIFYLENKEDFERFIKWQKK